MSDNSISPAPNPPILPSQASQPVMGAAHEAAPIPKKRIPYPLLFLVGILLIAASFVFTMRSSNSPVLPNGGSSPTPTPTSAESQSRPLSAIATTSAFIDFESQLDTVTRGVQNAPVDNQSLLPPKIDLPLGF